ncbi:MAG: hypothetical protein KDB80_08965 [Planctomycetes bacterium]|nr:hypothetical protein [Planctomycetota bacterium]
MIFAFDPPWNAESLSLLDARRGERVLQVTAHSVPPVHALLDRVGGDGLLVVVDPNDAVVDRLLTIEHPALSVIALEPTGEEILGRFDAMYASPAWNIGWPIERWGTIISHSLRPGGRFVLDLPAESACEVVASAWRAAGEAAGLGRWRGPSEGDAAQGLRKLGLRNVQGEVGTHLARFESPRELAEFATAELETDADFVESLRIKLAERLQTDGEIEVVFRRTCVHGIR